MLLKIWQFYSINVKQLSNVLSGNTFSTSKACIKREGTLESNRGFPEFLAVEVAGTTFTVILIRQIHSLSITTAPII